MTHFPILLTAGFTLTTLLSVFLFWRAAAGKRTLYVLMAWLLIQAIISLTGFYQVMTGTPPQFALLVLPPLIFIAGLFITKKGRALLNDLPMPALTLVHMVRVPVELVLLGLYICHTVPVQMTFKGGNYDILAGLTAPLVYLAFQKGLLKSRGLLVWNILALISLAHIVSTAIGLILARHPVALVLFPFTWLPAVVVPLVLLSHLAVIRKLLI